MNQFFSISLLFLGVIPFLGSLETNLDLDQTEQEIERVIVGSSPMTHDEKVAIQEERAKRAAEQEDEILEDCYVLEQEEINEIEEILAINESESGEPETEEKANNSAYQHVYYKGHEGAYHKPIVISESGSTVEIEDGSIWSIKSCDQHKVLNWTKEHTIVIVPNYFWFSLFDFRLVNQDTGKSVAANLSFGPIVMGKQSHWITGIDANSGTIILEDGSVWNSSNFDNEIVKDWQVKEAVIIGVNNSWFSGNKHNILINVDRLNYASCRCLN